MSRLRSVGLALAGALLLGACSVQPPDDGAGQNQGAIEQADPLPELGARIDRIGRPEVTNFVVRDPALKVLYNGEDSFMAASDGAAEKYDEAARAAIVHYDGFDGMQDFDDAGVAALAALLVEDQLRIDLGKPCDATGATYFEGERAELLGVDAMTCGGRGPNEDVFDTLMTLYTNGPARITPSVGDGVDLAASTGPATSEFPYLAKPHLLRLRPAQ